MSTVTITPEPDPEPVAKADDAAFAHGEAVGRFESHMSDCMSKHYDHSVHIAAFEDRIAAVESRANEAMNAGLTAIVQSDTAIRTAKEAEDEAEEAPVDVDVIEMEMPDIPTEPEEEAPKKSGFHLW